MKRSWIAVILAVLIGGFSWSTWQPTAYAAETLAIMSSKAVDEDWGTLATGESYLVDLFIKMKRFNVIERSQLEQIVKEQNLQLTGLVDAKTAAKIGKLAGAKYLVLYTVTSAPNAFGMGNTPIPSQMSSIPGQSPTSVMMMGMKMKVMMGKPQLGVSVRVVSVQDGRIMYNKNAERVSNLEYDPNNQETTRKIAMQGADMVAGYIKEIMNKDIGPDLQVKFPVQGYIIDVRADGTVEVDLGADIGIQPGVELSVMQKEPDRKHPVTGRVIPGALTEIAKLRVKQVKGSETSICEIISPSMTLKVGQVVERMVASTP